MEGETEPLERRPIDVPLLTGLSIGGVTMGVLSSFGALPGTWELAAWVALGTAALLAGLRRIPGDVFRHTAFGLTLAGFFGADAKVLLWDRFIANHPEMLAAVEAQGVDAVPRTAVIISDTITGILFGVVFGLLAVYVKRQRAR